MPQTLMCDPKLLQKDLSGRIYIVTGANSGSGMATATQLAKQGATVIGACRRVEAGKEVFAKLNARGSVEIMKLDLASLASVREFATTFLSKYDRLDGLVNNAGLVAPKEQTVDGFGIQFAVNHLGHFLLTELLIDVLKSSAPSRIVCLASVAHVQSGNQLVNLDFDDLDYVKRSYNMMGAYCESKLANVLHAVDLAQRLDGTGVSAFSVHPGWIRSNLATGMIPKWASDLMNIVLRPFSGILGIVSPFGGAQTTLHCLLDEEVPSHNGAYYSQTGPYPNREDRPGGWPMSSPNPHAHDKALAEKLYRHSLELVGLQKP